MNAIPVGYGLFMNFNKWNRNCTVSSCINTQSSIGQKISLFPANALTAYIHKAVEYYRQSLSWSGEYIQTNVSQYLVHPVRSHRISRLLPISLLNICVVVPFGHSVRQLVIWPSSLQTEKTHHCFPE